MRVTVKVIEEEVTRIVALVEQAVQPTALANILDGDVHDYVVRDIQLRFAYEGDSASGNWKPLADATQEIRAQLGFPSDTPINRRTGDMEDYVTTNYEIDVTPIGADLIVPGDIKDSVIRQKVQTAQVGNPGNIMPHMGPTPPRPILSLDEANAVDVLQIFNKHIMSALAGA